MGILKPLFSKRRWFLRNRNIEKRRLFRKTRLLKKRSFLFRK